MGQLAKGMVNCVIAMGLFRAVATCDVLRRRIQNPGAFAPARRPYRLAQAVRDEILDERAASSRGQRRPRGAKGNMSNCEANRR